MEGGRLLALALSIDKDDPDALCIAGRVTSYMFGDVEKAKEMVDRAVALNPNSSLAWEQRGWTYEYSGKSEEAIESFERSIRLSPLDPLLFSTYTGISLSLISLGRFEEARLGPEGVADQHQFFIDLALRRGRAEQSRARRRSKAGRGAGA